jgi:hypothetical protein
MVLIALASVSLLYGVYWVVHLVKKPYETSQVDDALSRYARFKQEKGSMSKLCIQAGHVAETYLRAGDDADYRNWKAVQQSDCAKAGLRR